MSKRFFLIIACLFSLFLTSCKVEFSPNAPWRDVPDVYCVIDPEEDTPACVRADEKVIRHPSLILKPFLARGAVRAMKVRNFSINLHRVR